MTVEALAEAVAAYIADRPGQRVRLEVIRDFAATVDPTLIGAPDARDRLNAVLTRLAEGQRIDLPRTRGSWDRRAQPFLPLWIAKHAPRPVPPPRPARVWPRPLEAAAAIATREDEFALLERIAAWMRDNPDAEPVPIEERSLELLDDEKALAIEVSKRLFTSGALYLSLLRCYATPLPFAVQHVPGIGPTGLLVAENNATFHSLLTVARALPEQDRPDLHIGWGSGNQFPTSIRSVPLLDPAPARLWYFGDLDLAGIRFAVQAAAVAAEIGLPPLNPCGPLYRTALDLGHPRPDRSNPGRVADHGMLLAWFPPDLRAPVEDLLTARTRIPQETVGLRVLRANPRLLTDLIVR